MTNEELALLAGAAPYISSETALSKSASRESKSGGAKLITSDLTKFLRHQFMLDWKDIHGAPHYSRVRLNGLMLARETRANTRVVKLFAFLREARREDDD